MSKIQRFLGSRHQFFFNVHNVFDNIITEYVCHKRGYSYFSAVGMEEMSKDVLFCMGVYTLTPRQINKSCVCSNLSLVGLFSVMLGKTESGEHKMFFHILLHRNGYRAKVVTSLVLFRFR